VDGGGDLDCVGSDFVGIEDDLIPVQVQKIAGGSEAPTACTVERQQVEGGFDLLSSHGNRDVERIHLDRVTVPCEFLTGGAEVESGDVGDGAAGAMIAGNPLGIDEGYFARSRGECEFGVVDVSGRVTEIDGETDRWIAGGLGSDAEKRERDDGGGKQRSTQARTPWIRDGDTGE
jgi:hypothetical protein